MNRKVERKPGFLSVYPFQTDHTNCDYFIVERKEWFDLNYLLWFFISLNKGTENNSPGTRSCVSVKLCMTFMNGMMETWVGAGREVVRTWEIDPGFAIVPLLSRHK